MDRRQLSRKCAPHHSRSRDPTRQCTSPSITKFLRTPYLRTALGNYRATPKAELQAVSGYRLRMSDAMRKSGLSISAPSILQTLPRHCKTCLHMSTGRERDRERERERGKTAPALPKQVKPMLLEVPRSCSLGPQPRASTSPNGSKKRRTGSARDARDARAFASPWRLALALAWLLRSPKALRTAQHKKSKTLSLKP